VGWMGVCLTPAFGAEWPQWRGPFFNGSTQERDLPVSWSQTENVAWIRPLPGPSGATPVIANGRVFVTSTVKGTPEFVALCFDAATGKELWRRQAGANPRKFPRNNMASPSPVTDGRNVFFLYGEGTLIGFDLDGRELWSRNIEKEYGNLALQFGYSNSPVLHDGKLYITVVRRNTPYREPAADEPLDSFIAALDPATGKTLWKQPRTTDAFDEGMETYSTLMPFVRDGKVELLMTGGDFITAHDPATGRELWRFEYWHEKVRDSRVIPSLVTGAGLIFGSRHKYNPVFALEPPVAWRGRPALASRGHPGRALSGHHEAAAVEGQGQDAHATEERGRDAHDTQGRDALATEEQGQDASATEECGRNARDTQGQDALTTQGRDALGAGRILWEFAEAASDCSTPLFYDGRLYVFDGLRRRTVTCLDPKMGRIFWQGRLAGRSSWWSSPTAADGKIYLISEAGEIAVLRAGGDEFKVLFETRFNEPPIQSSIAIAGGHLFIRTAENLYCIGK